MPQQVDERIDLPPIKPHVTQVRLFGGRCACCGEQVTADAPTGLERGSPFGHSIAATVVYLHYAHAIGIRLALLMDELFSLSISEGAISNILAREREPLLSARATIQAVVLTNSVVCSDETSNRDVPYTNNVSERHLRPSVTTNPPTPTAKQLLRSYQRRRQSLTCSPLACGDVGIQYPVHLALDDPDR
jgi:hypothetical protein